MTSTSLLSLCWIWQARGRPLSADIAEAVHAAALGTVEEDSMANISRSEIASRAQVSRQTLYNRWDSVGDSVLEALLMRGDREIGVNKKRASPRARLKEYVSGLATALESWAATGLKAVAATAQQDPEFAKRFRSQFLEKRQLRLTEVVEEACKDTDHDSNLIAELIAASMWYRLLISGQQLDPNCVSAMVSLVD